MARRYYSSIAARTTLVSGVDDTTNTFIVNAVSGWPSSTPYTLIIDQDTVNEEVVEVTNRSGTTLTVTRGVDGTSAVAHSAGAVVNHGVSARDFDEPNSFLNGGSWGLITAKGDIVAGTGSGTFDNLAVGANGTVLRADSGEATGLEWYDVATDLGLKFDKRPDQNLQTGSTYTFAADDDGKLVTASGAASATYTIPPQSSVTWADDTVLRIVNLGAGAVTVAGGSGVTVTNTATTIGQYEAAAAIRTGSDAWTLVRGGGGGGGKILQIVRATDSTQRSTTSTTYVDLTGLSVTITPQKSDSIVLLIVSAYTFATALGCLQITDNSNNAISGAEEMRFINSPSTIIGYATPATTSAVTYKARFRSESSGTTIMQNGINTGQIYAIEVSA